jgi:hypothetical protein
MNLSRCPNRLADSPGPLSIFVLIVGDDVRSPGSSRLRSTSWYQLVKVSKTRILFLRAHQASDRTPLHAIATVSGTK